MPLHRAIVSSRRHGAELVVFLECKSRSASARFESALGLLWGVAPDDLEVYNVHSEPELLGSHAFGDESTGDMRLLETGWSQGAPVYASPAETLFLVSPVTLKRLVAAQEATRGLASQQETGAAQPRDERLDAERYRYLRRDVMDTGPAVYAEDDCNTWLHGDELDAAIDAELHPRI